MNGYLPRTSQYENNLDIIMKMYQIVRCSEWRLKSKTKGLHFITNQVLFVHIMHIKVLLHHWIKLLDYLIIEYHILVFWIGEHQNLSNSKHNFTYIFFCIFSFSDFQYVGRYPYILGLVLSLNYSDSIKIKSFNYTPGHKFGNLDLAGQISLGCRRTRIDFLLGSEPHLLGTWMKLYNINGPHTQFCQESMKKRQK